MPPHGSAYSLVKSALVFALEARPALAGVAISYDAPVRPLEVTGPAGAHEAIWLMGAAGSFDDVVFAAGNLVFDETYTQNLVVQVLSYDTSRTQQDIEARAAELVFEVLAEVSGQKHWDFADLELDQFDYLYFTPRTQAWDPAYLEGTTGGRAVGCRLAFEVHARRSFV